MLKDVRTVRFIYKVISTVQTPLHRGQGSKHYKHCNKYFCRFYKTFWYKPELYVTRVGKKGHVLDFGLSLSVMPSWITQEEKDGECWLIPLLSVCPPPEALTGSSDIGNDPWPLTSPKLPLSQKNFNTIQKPSEANLISFFLISCLLIPHASMSAFYN